MRFKTNFTDQIVELMCNSENESLDEENGEVYEDYRSINGENTVDKNTTGGVDEHINNEYEEDYEQYTERYQEYGSTETTVVSANDTNAPSNDEFFRKKQKLFFYCWWILLILGWTGSFLVVGIVIGRVELTKVKIKRRDLFNFR